MREGVIQFELDHRAGPLSLRGAERTRAGDLVGWRQLMVRMGLVGRDPDRYDGLGFGNLSVRVPPWGGGRGKRPFLITGSQTGDVARLDVRDLSLVAHWDRRHHRIASAGVRRPSSESMTHAALYDATPTVRAVIHGHAPALWRAARSGELGALPTTQPHVGYGSHQMADEIHRLWRESRLATTRLLVMAGHEDGIMAFGRTLEEAATALLTPLAASLRSW